MPKSNRKLTLRKKGVRTAAKAPRTALEIMDDLWGKKPGWREGIERERQKFTLGELIRQAREARGWTQNELALRAHTSQSYISRIEDADYDRLMVSTLERIAAALQRRVEIRLPVVRERVKA